MQIGNMFLPHGVMLGPMAGYSDRAMRLICREMGAEYTVTEMVSAKALTFHDQKTPALCRIMPDEGPVAVQLFGREPDIMGEAAQMIAGGIAGGVPPVAIDINMGCPVGKITGNGEGSALMRDPPLAARIVSAVVKAVRLPVTVKIRSGWDAQSINAVDFALRMQEAGASAVCVHARTRQQLYSGSADWNIIKNVKGSLHIPVIGNGDILSAADALRMKAVTGCDGVMIARGAVGNPFLFREIQAAFCGKQALPATEQEKVEVAIRQLHLSVTDKGEYAAVRELRKQLLAYTRGIRGGAAMRQKISTTETAADLEALLLSLLSLE